MGEETVLEIGVCEDHVLGASATPPTTTEDDVNVRTHHTPISSFCSRPRFLYATVFCWISVCGGRFLALFLENVANLSATEIGLVLAVQQLVLTVLAPWASAVADERERTHPRHGRVQVLSLGVVLGTVSFLMHSCVSTRWIHMALQAMYALSGCFIWPVLDGITIHHLSGHGKGEGGRDGINRQEEYGRERLFGAVSWAVTNLLLSYGLDAVGFRVMYPLTTLSAAGALASLYSYARLQPRPSSPSSRRTPCNCRRLDKRDSNVFFPVDAPEPNDIGHDIAESTLTSTCTAGVIHHHLTDRNLHSQALSEPRGMDDECRSKELPQPSLGQMIVTVIAGSGFSCSFVFCIFCLSIGQILVDSLVFLLFEFLGSTFTVMGWTVVLTVAFEIPIFAAAPVLLKTLGTPFLLLLAALCYVVRVLVYSVIPEGRTLYVLLVEPLHGVTYACSQTAAVDFVARHVAFPPGHEASAQGLLQVVKGAGSVLGLVAGGVAEDTVGPRTMYRVSSGIVAVGSITFGCASWGWRCNLQNERHLHLHQRVTTRGPDDDNSNALELTCTDESSTASCTG